MNKLLLTLIFIGFAFSVKSQTATGNSAHNFTYNLDGLLPKFVVVDVDSMTQAELFEKTINWIKETYKNPDEVIKTTISNQKVRFEGFQSGVICVSALGLPTCYGATYTIEIEVKDGKYRFIPINIEYRVPASQYGGASTVTINFDNGLQWYNKGEVRKMFKTIPSSIENLLNGLNDSLFAYLSSEKGLKKEDW
jgi:hypothetical protein